MRLGHARERRIAVDRVRIVMIGTAMLTKYIQEAMKRATYEILPEDGSYLRPDSGFERRLGQREVLGGMP